MNDAGIGEITGAWDYSTLPPNVVIGNDCFLERKESFARYRSNRNPGLVIGDRVHVYTWTTFNLEPTGLVEVGSDSVLVGAVFMCADRISIGQRVVISYGVTIADSDFHPRDPELRRRDAIASAPLGDKSRRPHVETRPVTIEDDVQIGIGAIILKGVKIGTRSRIDAGTVLAFSVPPDSWVAGNPAQILAEPVQ